MKLVFITFVFILSGHLSIAQSVKIYVTDSIFNHSFHMENDFEMKINNCNDSLSNVMAKYLIYDQKDDLRKYYNLSNSDLLNLTCTYPVDSIFWIKLFSSLSEKGTLKHKIGVITVLAANEKDITVGYFRLYSKKSYKRYLKKVSTIRVYVDDISGEIKNNKIKSLFKNTFTFIIVYTQGNIDLVKCD